MKTEKWLLSKLEERLTNLTTEEEFYHRLITDICEQLLSQNNLTKICKVLTENTILKNYLLEYLNDKYLNVNETCNFLGICRASLYNYNRNPHFPNPKRIGRRILYSKNSLIEFLNKVKSFRRGPPHS